MARRIDCRTYSVSSTGFLRGLRRFSHGFQNSDRVADRHTFPQQVLQYSLDRARGEQFWYQILDELGILLRDAVAVVLGVLPA